MFALGSRCRMTRLPRDDLSEVVGREDFVGHIRIVHAAKNAPLFVSVVGIAFEDLDDAVVDVVIADARDRAIVVGGNAWAPDRVASRHMKWCMRTLRIAMVMYVHVTLFLRSIRQTDLFALAIPGVACMIKALQGGTVISEGE